jgi:hypothetical protein
MPNLEYVIRPYQAPTPFGTRVIPSSPSRGADRASLTWGATAQGTIPPAVPAPVAPPGMTYQFQCCQEKLQEQSRVTDTIRIMGNDGESYVDVERPKIMHLKRNEKQDCATTLEQMSDVYHGINQVLDEFTDAFVHGDTTALAGDDCNTQWTLTPP